MHIYPYIVLIILCLSLSVVAVLLCIVLSSDEESDVLQCIGEKLSDGQFYFNMPYEVKKDIYDCETQWIVDVYILCLK